MQPFNLEKALAGEPVKLNDGSKARVMYVIEDLMTPYRLRGYIADSITKESVEWNEQGESPDKNFTITGMWQEPRPQVTITIPAPLKEIPETGKPFYGIHCGEVCLYDCGTGDFTKKLCKSGLLFNTQTDAESFLQAMREARR